MCVCVRMYVCVCVRVYVCVCMCMCVCVHKHTALLTQRRFQNGEFVKQPLKKGTLRLHGETEPILFANRLIKVRRCYSDTLY